MSKEIAEKEGFIIGEKVLCFEILGNRKWTTIKTIRDVKYGGYDGLTVQIFLAEKPGYYSLNEIYNTKILLNMLNLQYETRDAMLTARELEALELKADDVWNREADAIEMNEMDTVFEKAKEKAVRKIRVGNRNKYTASPWNDFTKEFLVHRLEEEIEEWKVKYDKKELLDIINVAVFIYLCAEEK